MALDPSNSSNLEQLALRGLTKSEGALQSLREAEDNARNWLESTYGTRGTKSIISRPIILFFRRVL